LKKEKKILFAGKISFLPAKGKKKCAHADPFGSKEW